MNTICNKKLFESRGLKSPCICPKCRESMELERQQELEYEDKIREIEKGMIGEK